jgi:FtsP/CotA-like multicopper oxidase with cupredoxin domain
MQMGMLGNLYVEPAQDGNTALYPSGLYAYNDGDGDTGYDKAYPIQIQSYDADFHDASRDVQPLPFASMRDNYAGLNGRMYPDTVRPDSDATLPRQLLGAKITATAGERVLLRISNLSVTKHFTLKVLGVPMTVVGRGAKILRGGGEPTGLDLAYRTTAVTLGGGEAMDVILDTAGVVPGTYFMYTSNLNYLSNGSEDFGGMMTEIEIN